MNRFHKKYIGERITEFALGFGFFGLLLFWIICVLASIALPFVVIWAIIKLVFHFTA